PGDEMLREELGHRALPGATARALLNRAGQASGGRVHHLQAAPGRYIRVSSAEGPSSWHAALNVGSPSSTAWSTHRDRCSPSISHRPRSWAVPSTDVPGIPSMPTTSSGTSGAV